MSEYPESYYQTTSKEALVLEYVDHYNSQFIQLFSQRKPMLFVAKNEVDVTKFISTFIRPTKLSFKKLYFYEGAAEFVADYISYKPLENPVELPTTILTPQTVLDKHEGNCFEMSILLCSFLNGVGFDSYVVIGYADKVTTENDFSGVKLEKEDVIEGTKNDDDETTGPYVLPKREVLASKYLQMKTEREAKNEFNLPFQSHDQPRYTVDDFRPKANQNDIQNNDDKEEQKDPFFGKRIHSWVYVAPGYRGITEAFFIEPSTGQRKELNDKSYIGLEAIFNHRNYFINMQSCERGIENISFSFYSPDAWEFVFIPPADEQIIVPDQTNVASGINMDETEDVQILELPQSFIPKLRLSMKDFALKYPKGTKEICYQDATVSLYAPYYRSDGLIKEERFFDDSGMLISKIVQHYANRQHCLEKKITVPSTSSSHEYYLPNKTFHIKEIISSPSKTTWIFYDEPRPDGLWKRIEIKGKSIEEYFRNRPDNLIYHAINFISVSDYNQITPQHIKANVDKFGNMIIATLVEKFRQGGQNPDNVHIRTYNLLKDTITVEKHRDVAKLIAETKEYNKLYLQKADTGDVDNMDDEGISKKDFEILQKLARREIILITNFENQQKDIQDMMTKLQVYDQTVSLKVLDGNKDTSNLTRNLYDINTIQERLLHISQEQDILEPSSDDQTDYLAPFLPDNYSGGVLSPETSKEIQQKVLTSVARRLYDRAVIVEERIKRESDELERTRLQWTKKTEHMPPDRKQEEEFFKVQDDAHARIVIAKDRLAKIEKSSGDIWSAMIIKLRSDSRLNLVSDK
eukprot:TRINITY_DN3253_c1_g2_i1.p1 TRINITY_DN3253_c1_g2~~TRINITY_DN3253_c1_g2_i1.p1  ORF type:complete len:823 (+),score=222.69 TRINITY_DN3253_c1_g2_i1:60-2471(+)